MLTKPKKPKKPNRINTIEKSIVFSKTISLAEVINRVRAQETKDKSSETPLDSIYINYSRYGANHVFYKTEVKVDEEEYNTKNEKYKTDLMKYEKKIKKWEEHIRADIKKQIANLHEKLESI